jgi:hypothetical protein
MATYKALKLYWVSAVDRLRVTSHMMHLGLDRNGGPEFLGSSEPFFTFFALDIVFCAIHSIVCEPRKG